MTDDHPISPLSSRPLVIGGTFWFGTEMLKMVVLTIPFGLAAAYLFSAIGFGRGFGRWRFE